MTHLVAESIFWGAILVGGAIVYQSAILPSIRLSLRYRTFELRDRLRSLVMNGTVQESDEAFQLLHQNLNSMTVSLHRYDLARLVQSVDSIDGDRQARVLAALKVMDSAPSEVKKIYEESLRVFALALAFNSLFIVVFVGLCVVVVALVKVGVRHAKDAVVKKLHDKASFAFFSPELSAI